MSPVRDAGGGFFGEDSGGAAVAPAAFEEEDHGVSRLFGLRPNCGFWVKDRARACWRCEGRLMGAHHRES